MERLQEYDFEIMYRKGLSYKNADGLSSRPCASKQCRYYANVELKDTAKQENSIRRRALVEENFEERRRGQLEDSCISLFLSKKETSVMARSSNEGHGDQSLLVLLDLFRGQRRCSVQEIRG